MHSSNVRAFDRLMTCFEHDDFSRPRVQKRERRWGSYSSIGQSYSTHIADSRPGLKSKSSSCRLDVLVEILGRPLNTVPYEFSVANIQHIIQ